MPGFELIGKEEQDAAAEVFIKGGGVLFRHSFDALRHGSYKVKEFEREFAKKLNVKYARAVTSGTAALKVSLKALDIKPGDEVITQCFTFVATVEAIIDAGAKPVLTEINKTLNMDPSDLKSKITDNTRAIIPVHMLGAPCQMDEITSISKAHGIPIIEDTAQALAGGYKGKKLGTIGDLGIFSFDFGKALTTGEGGMVVTNQAPLYKKAKEYSDHGHEENPKFPRGEDTRSTYGFNYNMMELQGAIGLAQLKKLDYILQRQKENKRKINEGISDIPNIEFREFADEIGETGDTLVFFVEDGEKAKMFNKLLMEKKMGTKILPESIKWHFAGTWDHMLPQYEEYGGRKLMDIWENSHSILSRGIAIPIFVNMDDDRIDKIIDAIHEISEKIR